MATIGEVFRLVSPWGAIIGKIDIYGSLGH